MLLFAELRDQRLRLGQLFPRARRQRLANAGWGLRLLADACLSATSRDGFDTAQARAHARLGGDEE